ncbi:hypothetical protein WI24_12695 [Burkholderia thailandensis]|nr:hypothetical protein WI24_12695 [Burkholderia thailandensis]
MFDGLSRDAQSRSERRGRATLALRHGEQSVIAFQAVVVREPCAFEIQNLFCQYASVRDVTTVHFEQRRMGRGERACRLIVDDLRPDRALAVT